MQRQKNGTKKVKHKEKIVSRRQKIASTVDRKQSREQKKVCLLGQWLEIFVSKPFRF